MMVRIGLLLVNVVLQRQVGRAANCYWRYWPSDLTIGGHGGTPSREGATGKAFHTRSRLFTDSEWAALQQQLHAKP